MDKSAKKEHSSVHLKDSPKRIAPSYDLHHRKPQKHSQAIFEGYSFCFPFVDKELSPKQIDLLSESIQI